MKRKSNGYNLTFDMVDDNKEYSDMVYKKLERIDGFAYERVLADRRTHKLKIEKVERISDVFRVLEMTKDEN